MTKYSIGDRVVIRRSDYASIKVGTVHTVSGIEDGDALITSPNGFDCLFFDGELAPVGGEKPVPTPPPVPTVALAKALASLTSALVASGGTPSVTERLLEGSFVDALDVLARNNIGFTYKG